MIHLAATVTSKGQITIPQEIRRRLGLHEGDRVEFVIEGERTLICRHRQEANPFARYVGVLPAFRSKADINTWIGDLRDEEPSAE